MTSVRLFVAIDLAPDPRAALAALMTETQQAHPIASARWTPPPHLHVTLRFLGSVATAALPALRAALARVQERGFSLALAGVGAFPSAGRGPARVLWAGVTPTDPARALKAAVDAQLGPDPESQDRGFTPHVTLARVHDAAAAAVGEFLVRHADLTSAPWQVGEFVLYESRTTPAGPAYLALDRYPLPGA